MGGALSKHADCRSHNRETRTEPPQSAHPAAAANGNANDDNVNEAAVNTVTGTAVAVGAAAARQAYGVWLVDVR